MKAPNLNSTKPIIPQIYAYTTPGVTYHNGYIKIGYTEQNVDTRIYQQTHTAGIKANKEWQGNAIFEDGSGEAFRDHEFHAYLRKQGIKQPQDEGNDAFDPKDRNEWFHTDASSSRMMFYDFKSNRGILHALNTAVPYTLRAEQEDAIEKTLAYMKTHEGGEYLWNAKPRFGKTLGVYDFCKRSGAKQILIVTNRPAIANSWYSDYVQFLGEESGFVFVSETSALAGKPFVRSRSEYIDILAEGNIKGCIEFLSLQDMKGAIEFGGKFDKLTEVKNNNWDILVIDEAHEGVDTYKTDIAFNQVKRKFTLHLSGTPFKALANEKFNEDAIYNWTYADEQRAKRDWDPADGENPYEVLPKLNLYTYQMSEIIKDEIKKGIEINGETEEYAFDLNEFFKTENGRFVYDSSVDKFLDALTMQEKYPFSTEELRNEIKHSVWLLHRVDSAKALAKKLEVHPVFKEYKVVLAAGDGKLSEEDETKKSYNKVIEAIENNDKTITLTVGQLTTGVTVPEWTAVLMLTNIGSPSLYMQTAFRAQNPCLFVEGGKYLRKENAYVFDFDPARTLTIFEQFATDLSSDTSRGRGDSETRKQHIKELLNFFPVIGEDEDGEMVELDAEKVMVLPRKIRSLEVVRRGFMSNFLFQNISGIFSAPPEVLDIIEKFEPIKEPKVKITETVQAADELPINDKGEIEITDDYVEKKEEELFGGKIFDTVKIVKDTMQGLQENVKKASTAFIDAAKETIANTVIDTIKDAFEDIKTSDKKQIERVITNKTERFVATTMGDYQIEKNRLEKERKDALALGEDKQKVNTEFDAKQEKLADKLSQTLQNGITTLVTDVSKDAIKIAASNTDNRKKNEIEDGVRDHLRGFARTIPSFLMAYGDDSVTLATFDTVVPGKVFVEVTSITLEQFRFLRDGGNYTDSATGEEKHFEGKLFDEVVFDDSVKEFLRLKKKLADYFDEKSIEDIFDYIPPQKTFQIFTPKLMVQKMVDMLERENPGCFDDADKTFIDLYMKSGLYITEIVKRLYRSEKLKALFPDKKERLRHIFEKQVYGLAPTEIIYRIATSYILGFDEDVEITKHNFRQVDALPYVKEGTLQEMLDELFGEKGK